MSDHNDHPAPGWYPDPNGVMRWWDGNAWTATVNTLPQVLPPAPPGPPGPLQLDAGAAFTYSWRKFSQHAMFFAVATVVLGAIAGVTFFAGYIGLIFSIDPDGSTSIGWPMFAAGLLVSVVVGFVLQWILNHAALLTTAGIAPTAKNVFSTRNLGRYIVTSLLLGLVVTAGSILCLIPGLIAAVLFVYAPLISLDKGVGPVNALGRSYELARSNLGQTLLTLLLAYGILYAGSMVCYIGMVVTYPMSLLMIAYSYRVLEGEAVAP